MGKVAPARPDRGRDDLPRWTGTEHMPLYGWKSTMCQSGPPFRGRIGDERTICALRSGHGAGPPRLEPELRPAFRRNVADWGDATGVEGAQRRRADRGAGPEVRICSVPSQKRAFSGPPIGTWSVSRQPAPIGGGTGGPKAQSLWLGVRLMAGTWLVHALMASPRLEPRLLDSRSGEIGGIWQPPRLMD